MAETTKSPVFSSPSYWVALGAGVVGIAAAAMQERRGSADRYTMRDSRLTGVSEKIFDPDIPKRITLHGTFFSRDVPKEFSFEVDTADARMLNVVRDYLNARGFQFDPVHIEQTHQDADEGANFSIQDRVSNLLIQVDDGPIEVFHEKNGKMKKIGKVYEGFSASRPTSAKALKSLQKIESLLLKSRAGSAARVSDDRAYREAFNQAVDMANRFQQDVGLRRNALGGYSVYLFTEAERYSHRGQVVRPGEPKMPISGSRARGGNFGGMDEAEWHDDFFARYGRNTLTRLNRIAHEAELHYRPKDDPGYWGGMGTYRSMYDRILSGAKSYGIDERAAKAYASARGFYPEPKSKRRY